jgi:lysozyme
MKRVLRALLFTLSALSLASLLADATWAVSPTKIAQTGPGSRIAGIDISHWQHPGDAPINFAQMYSAGIRFVMIKGGDAQTAADALALKYLLQDRKAAQRAALYTGFYYYAYLPDSADPAFIIRDAQAQAQKVVWRIGQMGGYNRRDLPVALDLENNCQRINAGGTCLKYMARTNVTLWAKTWLATITDKTGRKPIFYSYPQFLESAMTGDPELRQYPLWMARYSLDPALTTSQPNAKGVGCFAHPWSNANCTAQWQFWQYTSCGIAGKYGVPGTRVDLNVFAGTSAKFLSLIRGTWTPDPADSLPQNEPTTMQLVNQVSQTTNEPFVATVDVLRPDGSPVVTGTVQFKSLDDALPIGTQTSVRAATGRWTVTVNGLVAGTYLGLLQYSDPSGTHSPNTFPVQFEVTQGTPPPTPSPTPTKTKTPAVDTCQGQIRN